ncbi:uncharacterized protein LOC111532360 [Piliocolobus tephrosceles]|uniref:uncharacterized protein LOC111532360 n=1 Tax=Piliocolobus tephrosceles TaxID=591936 RepID=UPI000C2A250C|nr:uncharacterized protein LOC111532360 [Piliocolobus tephrosceles]
MHRYLRIILFIVAVATSLNKVLSSDFTLEIAKQHDQIYNSTHNLDPQNIEHAEKEVKVEEQQTVKFNEQDKIFEEIVANEKIYDLLKSYNKYFESIISKPVSETDITDIDFKKPISELKTSIQQTKEETKVKTQDELTVEEPIEKKHVVVGPAVEEPIEKKHVVVGPAVEEPIKKKHEKKHEKKKEKSKFGFSEHSVSKFFAKNKVDDSHKHSFKPSVTSVKQKGSAQVFTSSGMMVKECDLSNVDVTDKTKYIERYEEFMMPIISNVKEDIKNEEESKVKQIIENMPLPEGYKLQRAIEKRLTAYTLLNIFEGLRYFEYDSINNTEVMKKYKDKILYGPGGASTEITENMDWYDELKRVGDVYNYLLYYDYNTGRICLRKKDIGKLFAEQLNTLSKLTVIPSKERGQQLVDTATDFFFHDDLNKDAYVESLSNIEHIMKMFNKVIIDYKNPNQLKYNTTTVDLTHPSDFIIQYNDSICDMDEKVMQDVTPADSKINKDLQQDQTEQNEAVQHIYALEKFLLLEHKKLEEVLLNLETIYTFNVINIVDDNSPDHAFNFNNIKLTRDALADADDDVDVNELESNSQNEHLIFVLNKLETNAQYLQSNLNNIVHNIMYECSDEWDTIINQILSHVFDEDVVYLENNNDKQEKSFLRTQINDNNELVNDEMKITEENKQKYDEYIFNLLHNWLFVKRSAFIKIVIDIYLTWENIKKKQYILYTWNKHAKTTMPSYIRNLSIPKLIDLIKGEKWSEKNTTTYNEIETVMKWFTQKQNAYLNYIYNLWKLWEKQRYIMFIYTYYSLDISPNTFKKVTNILDK